MENLKRLKNFPHAKMFFPTMKLKRQTQRQRRKRRRRWKQMWQRGGVARKNVPTRKLFVVVGEAQVVRFASETCQVEYYAWRRNQSLLWSLQSF
jgi:hypothetical protein